jgi:hypothetical protein
VTAPNVIKKKLNRPRQMFTQLVWVAVAPIRPWLQPRLPILVRLPHRKTHHKEHTMIVSELETIPMLYVVDLRSGQPRFDLTTAVLRQPSRSRGPQLRRLVAHH